MLILNELYTYIGIMATYLVLCLFQNKSNNFILTLFLDLRKESEKALRLYANMLRDEIASIYQNNPDDKIQEFLANENKLSKQTDLSRNLLNYINASQIVANNFFIRSIKFTKNLKEFGETKERVELIYIAQITLILLIVVMFVDALSIFSISIKCLFINLLIGIASGFSYMLYMSFLNKRTEKNTNHYRNKKNIFNKFICACGAFFIWYLLTLYINSPLVAFLVFPCIFTLSMYYMKIRKTSKCELFDRTITLKHCIYIVCFAIIITYLMNTTYNILYDINELEVYLNDFYQTCIFMQQPKVTYYSVLFFFSLNVFILPILVIYIKNKNCEKEIIGQMDLLYQENKKKVESYRDKIRLLKDEIEISYLLEKQYCL